MSIELENNLGFYISHESFLNKLFISENELKCKSALFDIFSPYSASKNTRKVKPINEHQINEFHYLEKEIDHVKTTYEKFRENLSKSTIFLTNTEGNNKTALETADLVYQETEKHSVPIDTIGCNNGPPVIKYVGASRYFFPENSSFYCADVSKIDKHLKDKSFDFILLDPPWWNKYIRRKRKKSTHAYNMMYNDDLKNIPINSLLNDKGIVAVWCTNSKQHFETLINEVFSSWNVKYVAKWFWLKVTKNGEPVCRFSIPPGKQPFEKIIIGIKKENEDCQIPDRKLIVSVPSAIHSHKPPLIEIMRKFLPENAKCLEIFARYLLPNWTSFGNEVLKLQHESLFVFCGEDK